MPKIKPPNYKFCPFCGKALETKFDGEKRRKFCPKDNWTYYPTVAASACAVIVKGKKVLMVKRGRDPYKNTWMFPAGFIDFGEHPDETVKREVIEETGLKPKSLKLFEIMQSTDDPRQPGHFIFMYKVSVSDGNLKTDIEENEDISWFDINNPPMIGWQQHKQIMKKLQEGEISTRKK